IRYSISICRARATRSPHGSSRSFWNIATRFIRRSAMTRHRLLSSINWSGSAVFLLIVLAWEAVVRIGLISYDYLPAPSDIARGFRDLVRYGILIPDIAHTLTSVAIGWTAGMTIGVLLGFWLGLSPPARRYSLATIEVLRPMPGVAFVPVGLLLFGFSLKT